MRQSPYNTVHLPRWVTASFWRRPIQEHWAQERQNLPSFRTDVKLWRSPIDANNNRETQHDVVGKTTELIYGLSINGIPTVSIPQWLHSRKQFTGHLRTRDRREVSCKGKQPNSWILLHLNRVMMRMESCELGKSMTWTTWRRYIPPRQTSHVVWWSPPA